MKYRLGLDVGTNSLGWSVLELDGENPVKLKAAGSRIFSDGRDSQSKATLAATRREKRSARRRRDRYIQRRTYLLSALTKAGLFPAYTKARKYLQKLNPLELRSRLLTEDAISILADLKQRKGSIAEAAKAIKPEHLIGRALFHLNQRRGFQSNRKDRSEESGSDGVVAQSIRRMLEEMQLIGERPTSLSKDETKKLSKQEYENIVNAYKDLATRNNLSYGKFLWERQKHGKSTRARKFGSSTLYDVYPDRKFYKDEFEKIWQSQVKYFPELMTDEHKEIIEKAIFTQRPLKIQERGICAYMSSEKRTFRAMPSFQRYRLYQEVNNLEWTTASGKHVLINYPEARDAIIDLLEKVKTKKGMVVWGAMKKILNEKGHAKDDFEFNFEKPKREGFEGNLTSNQMQQETYVGAVWHEWELDKQDKFIEVILSDDKDDEEVRKCLRKEYGLDIQAAENCMNALLPEGTANISQRAAKLMLEKMRSEMFIQSDAAKKVAEENDDFIDPMRRSKEDTAKVLPKLPYYGEVFQDRYIMPGTSDPADKDDERKYFGGVTNPTVHIALNQLRQLINELIDRFGHPYSIAIELGRELPAGEKKRAEINKEQKENQDKNEELDKKLDELGRKRNSGNRLRLALWEELGSSPTDCCCPYSGEIINITKLFTPEVEIDHIIPFSISLDDSRSNKVVCKRKANRDKGNQTPFEAFSDNPGKYLWKDIFNRIDRSAEFPKSKKWRFQKDALKIWYRDHDDFTSRHLNDTRYIGRLARAYLENICHIDKIDVLTGRLTALLRRHWGLNNVLQDDNVPKEEQTKKNRDDHRHHAVDAIVIAMTNRGMLNKIAKAAEQAEDMDLEHLFPKNEKGHSKIEPWDCFRGDVKKLVKGIVVSHKARKKKLQLGTTDSQLHKDTALGLIKAIDKEKNEWQTVFRRPIKDLKKRKDVEAIRDSKLRTEFLNAFNSEGVDGIVRLAEQKEIRRLRCFGPKQAIPIYDQNRKSYKGYQGGNNWGIEIYAFPESDEWEGVPISSFNANKPGFQPGTTYRPAPTARLVMRLQINDCIEIEENGARSLVRIQKIRQNRQIFFAPLHEANVAKRASDKEDKFEFKNKTANTLKSLNPKKVHISVTGQVSYECRYSRSKKN